MIFTIGQTFMFATPIIIAAIGGLYSERSGVTNIALEGIMLVGAFVAATLNYYLGIDAGTTSFYATNIIPWICVLGSAFVGMIYSIILAVASIKYKADQIISGTALNMLATGITVFLAQVLFNQQITPSFGNPFIKLKVGFLGEGSFIREVLEEIYTPFFLALIIVFITAFIVKKTKFGLRLRACGEFPQAAASMGINVYKMRYIAVLISGFLGGLAGGIMVLTADQLFSASAVHGFGFIAIATLIFGKWNSWGVLFAGLFFGFSNVLAIISENIEIFKNIPQEVFHMLPYVLTIIALVVTSGKSSGPKAVGEIYDETKR